MRWNCWQIVESFLYKIRTRYPTQPVSFLLMSWRRKEPGHQHLRYWPGASGLFRSYHQKLLLLYAYIYKRFYGSFVVSSVVMSYGGHHVAWWPLPGLLSWYPFIYASLCDSSSDQTRFAYISRSSSELQGLSLTIGLRYSSPSCGRQGDMPYSATLCSVLLYLWIKIYLKRTHW